MMNKSRFFAIACVCVLLSGCAAEISEMRLKGLNQSLIAAAKTGNWIVAENIIKEGADVNAQSAQGETSLYFAADSGNMDAVEFLVKHGANVNIADEDGETPLDRAALRSFLDVVRYLVQNGASASN